ncbi:MAG: dihydroorotate dehydrogenase (quinone) [Robiginitomaculum sp.]|nr:MAG: dihydroorotate dehydrogenase (quinone) [Robiginitomaculum sp.]
MSLLHNLAPKALRLFEAERAHKLTLLALKNGLGPTRAEEPDPILASSVAGLELDSPIGLAAGFDKNAEVPLAMARFGFGWIECGTVTPLAQSGNPRPRLFRLPADRAVINRLGFNNQGLEVFQHNFAKARERAPKARIGANIGANKQSTDRMADYCLGLEKLWGLPSWFTINISSPNTPGLRDLQSADALDELLARLSETRQRLSADQPSPPFFLKVAPDLDEVEIEDITSAALRHGISALIVSNTTLARPEGLRSRYRGESGGLSGAPLFEPSTQILRLFHQASKGSLPLIGVGGISNADQVWQKITAGASAVQLYSALIYHGPGLVQSINRQLAVRLRAEGYDSISDLVGTA